MRRLSLGMSLKEVLIVMSEGNPGALTVLAGLYKHVGEVDPDAALGWLSPVFTLDGSDIRGPEIWMLYKDVCRRDLAMMVAVLRARQLGIISTAELKRAIHNEGEGLNLEAIKYGVQTRLPNFNFDWKGEQDD